MIYEPIAVSEEFSSFEVVQRVTALSMFNKSWLGVSRVSVEGTARCIRLSRGVVARLNVLMNLASGD